MDGIELELMWSRLCSIVSEHAKAMQRTSFSTIVRESGDLAYGLFDARSRMVAQGADPAFLGHEAFRGFLAAEMPRWAQAVKASGTKLD